MKNKICPDKISCWRYDASKCDGCAVGDKFIKQRKRIARLEEENAALRERLENAVELPRIIHPNKNEWFIQFQLNSGIIDYNIRYSKESAEARLAELKGESHETTN